VFPDIEGPAKLEPHDKGVVGLIGDLVVVHGKLVLVNDLVLAVRKCRPLLAKHLGFVVWR